MIARLKLIQLNLFAHFAIFSICSGAFAQSERPPENYSPPDTIFNEIILTEEGVVAIDTAGYEWFYDFEYSTFVPGKQPLTGLGYGDPSSTGYQFYGTPIEERATVRKKVKHFEVGSVTVREDEFVEGDIRALEMVTVKGWVQGDVISLRDRVLVTESGVVDGDIEAPHVIVKTGGVVGGEIIESNVPIELKDFSTGFSHEFLLVMIFITLGLMFFGFILLALMPRQVGNIEDCIVQNRGRSFFMGFLTLLVMPALIVLIAITIIGVVLIPLLPVLYAWAMILGITATGRGALKLLFAKFRINQRSPILMGAAGILLVMVPWIMTGAFFGSEDETAVGFGVFFLVVSILTTIFPLLSGIGAAFLTRFGFRTYSATAKYGPKPKSPTSHAPAPPPIPDAPLVQKEETKPSGPRISDQK